MWNRTRELGPVIDQLYKRYHAIAQEEVARTVNKLPNLTDADREQLEELVRRVVNKLLHEPTSRLRAAAHEGHGIDYVESVRYLFDLNDDSAWQTPPQDEP